MSNDVTPEAITRCLCINLADTVSILTRRYGKDTTFWLSHLCASDLLRRILDINTELWGEAPAYLAQLYEQELFNKYKMDIPELLKSNMLDTETYRNFEISEGQIKLTSVSDYALRETSVFSKLRGQAPKQKVPENKSSMSASDSKPNTTAEKAVAKTNLFGNRQ